ncbi:tRNA pseudouridine(55) synthase TruB, partial [Leptolyngbya sp. FACHB-36]|uniref:tRNA pseudouridine(55) synthase TruB n=1 Tax=Leptolyngbya sp. FACHB-36 TaxID=2692808 RepID=UPI0016807DF1
QQVPPNYSAIQVQGKRLYDLARSGHAITVPARTVEVSRLEVLDWRSGDFPELDLAIACGPGTYIRSIARDLGDVLQVGGTLVSLVRTHSSGFDLTDSLTLEQLDEQLQQGFQPIAPEIALTHLNAIVLPADLAKRWCQGQRVAIDPISAKQKSLAASTKPAVRVHHETNTFLGIGTLTTWETDTVLLPQVVFDA